MSPNELEAKLRLVITEAIAGFPQASPVDLVRWTRENHGELIGKLERKWADDKLVSLYLTAMRQRAEAKATPIQGLKVQPEDKPTDGGKNKPGPPDGKDTGQKPLDRKGRPIFGHPGQIRLPFSEQFENIPFWLTLKPRTNTAKEQYVRLPNATLADLKVRRALIRGEQSVELPQLNRLIGIMQAYDKMQPGIRVKQALELRSTRRREDKQA
jgi:hypothetical protein